jgi:hypothetical protein
VSQPSSYRPVLGAPRALPRYLPFVTGESFRSYIERLAVFNNLLLAEMISRLGMSPSEDPTALSGFGIILSDKRIGEFARVTRIPERHVRAMLLTAFDGIALDLSGINPDDPKSITRFASREWAYLSGSHYCPGCLRQSGGAWQLAWKLPWSYSCVAHSCLLESVCPGCGQRAARGRADRSLSPAFHARKPALCRCANPLPTGLATKGRSGAPCGHDLAAVAPVSIANSERLLDYQQTINRLLALDKIDREHANATFLELRSLTAFVLYAAEPSDLGPLPQVVFDEFQRYALDRNKRREERVNSEDRRGGAHARTYIGAPQSAKLMAAVIPFAIQAVGFEGRGLREHLQPLVDHIDHTSRTFRWQLLDYFKFSDRLRGQLKELLASRGTFDRRAGSRSQHVSAPGTAYTFVPANIPQLLPLEMFVAADGLFPGTFEYQARRFCAMALVKLCGGTWANAAEHLDLPASMNKMANKVITTLNATKGYDRFVALLHEWARHFSERQSKTDFASLRRGLQAFEDFPLDDWVRLCREAGVAVGERGGRSRYAAAWWWAEATQGDWRLAPSMASASNMANAREVFRTMEKSVFSSMATVLRSYKPADLERGCRPRGPVA